MTHAQINCGFDSYFQPIYQSNPSYFNDQEQQLQQIISSLKKSAMSGPVTIPVVFHIIHQGESINVGGNIPNSQIVSTINSLNSDFNGTNIQFCLAQRDPQGNAMQEFGVKRVNGQSIGYNGSLSMGGNESAIKQLSYFSNARYLNIWVVSNIISGATGQVLGFATFPNSTPDAMDGIVMDRDFMGVGNWHVLTHEAGHFLNLYHTFHGDDPDFDDMNIVCPPLDTLLGDLCGDTQAHTRSTSGTCPSGPNPCYSGQAAVPLLQNISNNHMDYSSEACRNHFSTCQIMRMQATLMGARLGLTNSLGCTPACTPNFVLNYSQQPSGAILINTNVTFTASLPNAGTYNNYQWYVNDISQGNNLTLSYTFTAPGSYTVSFRAANTAGCVNEVLKEINVITNAACQNETLPTCEELLNGDFSQYNQSAIEEDPNPNNYYLFYYIDFGTVPVGLQSGKVCNWVRISGTPTLFLKERIGNFTGKDLFALQDGSSVTSTLDIISTENEVNLEHGKEYKLSFLYGGQGPETTNLQFEFRKDYYESGFKFYEELNIPSVSTMSILNERSIHFTYDEAWGKFLSVRTIPKFASTSALIADISITECCQPKPIITSTPINNCTFKFDFSNEGDPASLFWTIEAGPYGTASSTTQSFVLPGTYKVCLYAQCEGVNKEECIFVKSDGCNIIDCNGLTVISSGAQCAGANNATVNFTLNLPEGYTPCGENLYMVPAANYSNYFFNDNTNTLQVSANFPNPNQDFTLVVCGPNGEQLCYTIGGFATNGTVCTSCQDLNINVTASCNDNNTNDLNFSYGGSITITPPDGATPCGGTSTAGGYSQGIPTNNAGTYTIPFNINTNNPNPFNSEVTICFFDPSNNSKICYKVNIIVSNPCAVEGCLNLNTSTLVCSDVKDGSANFNFSRVIHNSLFNGTGWELCSSDGIILPLGTANTNIAMQTQSGFLFDFDISMPCEDIEKGKTINIILNFCKGNETICFEFTVLLECAGCGGKEGKIRASGGKEYKIYPSPAANDLYVEVPFILDQYLSIYDINGRMIEKFKVHKGSNKLSLNNFNSGLHYCMFSKDIDVVHKILISKN